MFENNFSKEFKDELELIKEKGTVADTDMLAVMKRIEEIKRLCDRCLNELKGYQNKERLYTEVSCRRNISHIVKAAKEVETIWKATFQNRGRVTMDAD